MDQEVEIINTETRKEKIKNFIINKKNTIIAILVFFCTNIIWIFYLPRILRKKSS